jgi:hypothetical protein
MRKSVENLLKNVLKDVTRFEVIDRNGRQIVNYNVNVELSFQDEDKTLKVFITDKIKEKDNENSSIKF